VIERRPSAARAALAVALVVALARAGSLDALGQTVPSVMNYQGRLTDNTPQQTPINLSLPMAFAIYDSSLGGTSLWTESWPAVTVVNGIFSVLLGSSGSPIPTSVFTGGTGRYLEIAINGETLTPRQQLGAAGWAARAETAAGTDCADCIGSPQVADGSISGADIAPDAIGAGHLASGSVGSSEMATASVTASKIAASAVDATHIAADAVGNLELNGADQFTFNGGVIFEASGAEFVSRSGGTPKLEWWADSGISYLYHRPAATYLLVNDTTGNWGIDVSTPLDRFHVIGSVRANAFVDTGNAAFLLDPAGTSNLSAVNVASVDVSGTSFIGWESVSTTYAVDTLVSSCHSHGGLACYVGSGCATCSAGKVVIGGGCYASSARYASISGNYPLGTTQWCCESSYDISGTDNAYAICARVGN